ncbi:hypothetical protein pdam_00007275 [Pocillopora damicornis]|uniref:Uncharacterized protein n=1 Tax=Pocillopora damicornis TaxID=46731 RepID=A0A3M6UN89_POCDA|nr:hypothetical protein pdam_00007275 [Pocillopora damicornis]
MPNPNISTQDWYYHAPSKRVVQPAKPAPAASQIPGIGGLPDELANPEGDDRHFRRKWIRDTDSKYIKLAKGGGRKNLLTFRSPQVKAEEPVPYPRVEWFDHEHPEEEVDESSHEFVVQNEEENKEKKQGYQVLPEWYVHVHDVPADDEIVTGSYRSKRPIMGFDNLSKWQRENEQVDFKHLMSMGYQRDWLQEQKQKTKEEKGEKKKQQEEVEDKREKQHNKAIRKPNNASDSDKPMFKLSKFERVQPRVESFRT